ncbi:hypothetical protein JZ751_017244, partial [Albula glossodonta]
MADLEDVTLDGRPLHSLRVADLKAALEQRGLSKSGQKNALIKRLKGEALWFLTTLFWSTCVNDLGWTGQALMLENLQRTSTPHIGLQPNSQIGEEMSQNSFIKQYLAKQQELLRQRLEREAREAAEADGETPACAPFHGLPAPHTSPAPVSYPSALCACFSSDEPAMLILMHQTGPCVCLGVSELSSPSHTDTPHILLLEPPDSSVCPLTFSKNVDSPAGPDHEDHSEANDSTSCPPPDQKWLLFLREWCHEFGNSFAVYRLESEGIEENCLKGDPWGNPAQGELFQEAKQEQHLRLPEPVKQEPVSRVECRKAYVAAQEISPVVGAPNKRHPFDQREDKAEGDRGWGRPTDQTGGEDGSGGLEEGSQFNARRTGFFHSQDGQGDASEPQLQEVPGSRARRSSSRQSRDDPAPSSPSAPPRAVASLSVRVVGEPDRQQGGLVPHPRPEPTVHSAGQPAMPRAQQDSDEDSDEDEEEEEDDEEDWEAGPRRGSGWDPPAVAAAARERSRRTHQPPQHIPQPPQLPHHPQHPQLQLRQPTPPPSPPPELSFPLPETPKQSPPSLDEPEAVAGPGVGAGLRRQAPEGGRSPPALQRQDSSSSSGSSSSNSRSSSPEPHGGAGERKPGPLTLLARKMESEGAFAASKKKGRSESEEQELMAAATPTDGMFPGNLLREGAVTAIAHTAGPAQTMAEALTAKKGVASAAVPTITFSAGHQGVRSSPFQAFGPAIAPTRVLMAMAEEAERDAAEMKGADAVDLHKAESREAAEAQREREKALEREREEREKALEKEREREEREKALQREREERERQEREKALQREREEREREEREKALQREREEREREEREKALQREREEREREEREKALQREREEREREEREKALQREREERERALQREREEREKALQREKEEREKALQREREEREKALQREREEREREEREKALQREKEEREKALQREKEEREKALQREREERERALQREREEKEKALEREREKEREERERAQQKEREEREKALQREREEREKALEREREREREEREKAQQREREEREKALERDREEKAALEREKERESRLPPWKRGREFGGLTSSLMPTPALSAVAGKVPETEKKDPETEEPTTGHPLTQTPVRPGESQPSTPLPPPRSSAFLRDTPLLSSPSSASATPLIKRPRTFSDTPPTEAPTLTTSPRRPGLGEEGASGGESATPATEGAIVPQGAGDAPVAGPQPMCDTARPPWLEGMGMGVAAPAERAEGPREDQPERGRPKPAEADRPGRRVEAESPKGAAQAQRGLLEAMGPVLPPSPPPEEAEAEREPERKAQSSPSSDSSSSDSDSASSSSHSSGSSSSSEEDKSRS